MSYPPSEPTMSGEDPSRPVPPPLPAYQPPAHNPAAAPGSALDPTADAELMARARKSAVARADFRKHLVVYAAVLGLLVAIWLLTTPGGYFWPIWPALGWGLGLVLHGASLGWDSGPSQEQVEAEARRLAAREQRGRRDGQQPPALED